jgi:outer membrane protein assembly factor BamB/LysM repeat protein
MQFGRTNGSARHRAWWIGAVVLAMLAVRGSGQLAQVQVAEDGEGALPPSGAMLETSADADSLLSRAREYIDADQYREALLLLQHVTDNFGNLLTTADGLLYVPARQMVEQTLRDLPADGLDEYRLTADGEARGLLKGQPAEQVRDVQVLRQVAERYFISSVGDDAAMALAGHLLDQGKHHAARRWLVKVAQDHPDPSVDPAVLQTRLLAASVGMGDTRGATRALNNLQAMPSIEADRLAMLKQYVESVDPQRNEATQDWPMAYGGPTRNHVMPAMAAAPADLQRALDRPRWAMVWSAMHDLAADGQGWGGRVYRVRTTSGQSRPHLVKRWNENNWQPTTQAVFRDGRVYYKMQQELFCRDARTGRLVWESDGKVTNSHYHGGYSTHSSSNLPQWPSTAEEIFLFGDRVGRQVALIGQTVYHIAGHEQAVLPNEYQLRNATQNNRVPVTGNMLVAVDAKTGQRRWTVGRSGKRGDELANVRVLATPLLADDQLLVPVEIEDELFIARLDPATGMMIDKSFVCAYGRTFAPPWSPVAMAVADGELYVAPAQGVLVAMSLDRGEPLWVSRYERSQDENRHRHFGNRQTGWGRDQGISGWEQTSLIVGGTTVALMPWDAEAILLFDRQSGRQRVREGGEPAVKVQGGMAAVGLDGQRLIVAERTSVFAIDMETGTTAWRAPIDKITGRPAMTADGIYIPAENRIIKIDPTKGGKRVAEAPITSPRRDPVGNVFSDGHQLLCFGMNWAYAANDADVLLSRLNQQIDQSNDVNALFQRAELFDQLDMPARALADYRLAFAHDEVASLRDRVRTSLFEHLLAAAKQADAEEAIGLLDEAEALVDDQTNFELRLAMARADVQRRAGKVMLAAEIFIELLARADEAKIEVELPDELGTRLSRLDVTAAEALGDLTAQSDADALAGLLARRADEVLAAAQQAHEAAELRSEKSSAVRQMASVASRFPHTAASLKAIEYLGEYNASIGLEANEALLSHLRTSQHRPTAAAATVAMADLYAGAGWNEQARRYYTDASRRFGDLPVPIYQPAPVEIDEPADQEAEPAPSVDAEAEAEPVAPDAEADVEAETEAAPAPEPTPTTTYAVVLAERIAALPEVNAGEAAGQLASPPWEQKWQINGYGNHVIDTREFGDSQFLKDHMLVMLRNSSKMELHKAGEFDVNQPVWSITISRDVANSFNQYNSEVIFSGDIAGHLLVLRGQSHNTVYSMISGKRLWSSKSPDKNYQPHNSWQIRQYREQGLSTFAVGDGLIAQMLVDESLLDAVVVHDATSGRQLWKRQFVDTMVDGIWISGGYVIILSDQGKQAWVCDSQTGALVGRGKLNRSNSQQPIVWDGHRVYYQSGRHLVCVSLPDFKEQWRQESQTYNKFGKLDAERLWVNDRRNRVLVISIDTGKVLVEIDREALGLRPDDAAMTEDGADLFVVGYGTRNSNRMLAIVDMSTGKRRTLIDFGQYTMQQIPAKTLAAAGDLIPWANRHRKPDGNWTSDTKIQFFKRSDGTEYTEHALPGPKGEGMFQYLYRPPQIIGDALIISSNNGVTAFGTSTLKDANGNARNAERTYTVQAGDTLFSIAQRFYGDGRHFPRIMEANKQTLKSPDQLKVGLKLRIPPLEDESNNAQPAKSEEVNQAAEAVAPAVEKKKPEKAVVIEVEADTPMKQVLEKIEQAKKDGATKVSIKKIEKTKEQQPAQASDE